MSRSKKELREEIDALETILERSERDRDRLRAAVLATEGARMDALWDHGLIEVATLRSYVADDILHTMDERVGFSPRTTVELALSARHPNPWLDRLARALRG